MTDTYGPAWARQVLATGALGAAPSLLGAVLGRRGDDGAVVEVRITEVEAYEGESDPGSHAARGLTRRNASMFGPPGLLYVYRHLGLHHCVNLVAGSEGTGAAVLVRAGEVVTGTETALERRRASGVCRTTVELARGPARLAVALNLDTRHDGVPVAGVRGAGVWLLPPTAPVGTVLSGPRVGVSGEGGDADRFPWRWYLEADPTVSRYRRAGPGRALRRP